MRPQFTVLSPLHAADRGQREQARLGQRDFSKKKKERVLGQRELSSRWLSMFGQRGTMKNAKMSKSKVADVC